MPYNKSKNKPELKFQAIGTEWSIAGDISESLKKKVGERIEQFNKTYSRFIEDSTMRRIASKKGEHTLPKDAEPLFDFYKSLYEVSDGLVTPLIGKTMEQAGYDTSYSFKSTKLTKPPSWHDALEYNFPKITIKQPVVFDFGAAGKGYLVDIISKLLQNNGVNNFSVNAGGDMFIYGESQVVGLENPDNPTEIIGTVSIKNEAICASAGNRRKWENFHHTINPQTLQSPKNVHAIWVKAKTAMLADGLTTALYFTEPAKLLEHFEFEYAMIVDEDLLFSKNFKGEFFK